MNIRRPADIRRKCDKQNSRKHLLIILGSIFFVCILVGIFFGIRRSPLFQAGSITVSGVSDAYGQQILSNLNSFSNQQSILFRLLGDRNMIAWGGMEKSFMEANPDIKEMDIEKEYFKRTVVVKVISREKFGVWCQFVPDIPGQPSDTVSSMDDAPAVDISEQCYWFDTEGVLFAKAPLVRSELFNRVFDSTGRPLVLRDRIMPDRLFQNLVRIFKVLEMAQINTKTVNLSDLALEQVEAASVSDPLVIFSLRSDPSFALSAINALKRSGEWGKLRYANFTVENKVSYK